MNTLNTKGVSMAFAAISGLWMLAFGLISMATGWGAELVDLYASIIPGYAATFGGSIIGGIVGFIYGWVMGWLLVWFYNMFSK